MGDDDFNEENDLLIKDGTANVKIFDSSDDADNRYFLGSSIFDRLQGVCNSGGVCVGVCHPAYDNLDSTVNAVCGPELTPAEKAREEKRLRMKNRITLPAQKMTSSWGPTHTFEDSTVQQEIVSPQSVSKTKKQRQGQSEVEASTPDNNFVKKSSGNITPVTVATTTSTSPESNDEDDMPTRLMNCSRPSINNFGGLGRWMDNASTAAFKGSVTASDMLRFTPFHLRPCVGSPGNEAVEEVEEVWSKTVLENKSPLHRRIERHKHGIAEMEGKKMESKRLGHTAAISRKGTPPKAPSHPSSNFPVDVIKISDPEFSDSISELTMKSSHGEAIAQVSDDRRMAYYAVGKHYDANGGQNKGSGNRRCFFTGKVIQSETPFYAGCLQQGLRTLVVFCRPIAIGLRFEEKERSRNRRRSRHIPDRQQSLFNEDETDESCTRSDSDRESEGNLRNSNSDKITLQSLPEPSQDLLDRMATRYPEQFDTLPIQMRDPYCWRLFIRFCFFSGLPIAEGELHYKVREEVSNAEIGDDIILSHDVMEAVNGVDSACILKLPNTKTFSYLKKHYTLQSSKLSNHVFDRKNWELVLAEI